jgi:hypothetical protein
MGVDLVIEEQKMKSQELGIETTQYPCNAYEMLVMLLNSCRMYIFRQD